jgi:hypothetical protein
MHGRKKLILLSIKVICMFRLLKASAGFYVFQLAHLTFNEPEDL